MIYSSRCCNEFPLRRLLFTPGLPGYIIFLLLDSPPGSATTFVDAPSARLSDFDVTEPPVMAGRPRPLLIMLLTLYLDEFTFRFNRRRTPMAAFQTLLGLATLHGPTTYDRLYCSESTG